MVVSVSNSPDHSPAHTMLAINAISVMTGDSFCCDASCASTGQRQGCPGPLASAMSPVPLPGIGSICPDGVPHDVKVETHQLSTRRQPELHEHLAQVMIDGAR